MCISRPDAAVSGLPAAELATRLAEQRPAFSSFLKARLGNAALADDILQGAMLRAMERADSLRSPESLVPWFRSILRTALIDHYRREATASRARARLHDELEPEPPRETAPLSACRCVKHLASTLRPEYASALQRVEVDGVAVKDYVAETGISRSHAGVRVFRARAALRKRVQECCGACASLGCLECTCQPA